MLSLLLYLLLLFLFFGILYCDFEFDLCLESLHLNFDGKLFEISISPLFDALDDDELELELELELGLRLCCQ